MPSSRGFTLIEILVVVAIIGIIVSLAATADLNTLKGDTFRAEESTIVSMLTLARSRAMNNMFETSHGVCYVAPNYVIFQGSTCDSAASTSELTPANISIASNGSTIFPAFVFNRLTGNTTNGVIHITDGVKSADIILNNEGTINW